eukprot:TRINITY_DN3452_c0_g1_i10.p1 TRINITY_DN3452_c0_g1~~TRINITY_DN3452_c0_g1_i10.p1  ORF type:complete len:203 (-),score=21.83 TRINITY_DN3452_c0_g1_i10:26-634(-)
MSSLDESSYRLWTCKHSFCLDCSQALVKDALTDTSKIPIKCPTCEANISLFDLRRLLNEEESNRLNLAAKNKFMRQNMGKFFECPTPECKGLGRKVGSTYDCRLCSQKYCLSCKQEEHKGMTCAEYENHKNPDRAFSEYLRNSTCVPCPHCTAVIEKNGGCNHVTCYTCKKHICFFPNCYRLFETSTECYTHMRQTHGGIGL